MKRLLYIAFNDCENGLYGVRAKILSQCRAFEKHGFVVDRIERRAGDTIITVEDGSTSVIGNHRRCKNACFLRPLIDKQNQMKDIRAFVRTKHYDACYIRYDFSDPGFTRLLADLRKVCGKTALEIPTFPYDDENRETFLSRSKLFVDRLFRGTLRLYVDFIVTFYGGYERIFGIPVLTVPNGFDFGSMDLVKTPLEGDVIRVIAVSSMRRWHGYERFIEGMHRYYAAGGSRAIVLHLVGRGRECARYRQLSEMYGLADRVLFEGTMHGRDLDAVYERCALGIDSLGRHRSGIEVLSSLKSREYGAKGIPIINGCRIDIIDDDFEYLLRVPADESPVDIEAVIDFHDRVYAGRDRLSVAREIRAYIESRSRMEDTMSPVARRLSEKFR